MVNRIPGARGTSEESAPPPGWEIRGIWDVPIATMHPGAGPTNGLVQKMGRFPWQELDEVGDLGRFPVKKRRRFFLLLACWPDRASSARFSRATARRLWPRRAASEVIEYCGHDEPPEVARFRVHLASLARDRPISSSAAEFSRNLATAGGPR
jgi:hypothetical protein